MASPGEEGRARRRRGAATPVGVDRAPTGGEVLWLAARLAQRGEPFALATVVRRLAPSSAQLGQKALIDAAGRLHGWLGGSCIEPIVRREAERALREGKPRLVVLAPDGRSDRPEAAVYRMTCHSGGMVEIYVEPQLPAPQLVLFGDSPIGRALAALAAVAGYEVRAGGVGEAAAEGDAMRTEPFETATDPPARRELYAVVATMGEWDEEAVEQALAAGAAYVGLVASPRRADEVRRRLTSRGLTKEALRRLVSPAGLDVGAKEPAEVAVTILAQIIQLRRGAGLEPGPAGEGPDEASCGERVLPQSGGERAIAESGGERGAESSWGDGRERDGAVARDPVCGMEVGVSGARHVLVAGRTTHYFCSAGCRERFTAAPARFTGS
ncbi:MAG: XdhC family protein [Gemmatimonadota bacterium]